MNATLAHRLLLGLAMVAAWELISRVTGPYWISSPWLVVQRTGELLANGDLWFHGRFTLAEAFGGFVLGAVPGCLAAMTLRDRPLVRASVLAVASLGYAVPKTALVPLFILWLGVGPATKVALVASAIFFIVFFSTLNGVDAVDVRLIQSSRVMGASERQVLRYVLAPSIVPYVFGGLRVAVPYAIAGAIVGEIISSNRGLGYLAQYGAMDFDTTLIFVALLTVMVMVLAVSALLVRLERRLLSWRHGVPVAPSAGA
jgi:NitT/TauT family transport system permease protein